MILNQVALHSSITSANKSALTGGGGYYGKQADVILEHFICWFSNKPKLEYLQVIYAGDSAADESAMEVLKGVAYTYKVINEDTTAITKTWANSRLQVGGVLLYSNLPGKDTSLLLP